MTPCHVRLRASMTSPSDSLLRGTYNSLFFNTPLITHPTFSAWEIRVTDSIMCDKKAAGGTEICLSPLHGQGGRRQSRQGVMPSQSAVPTALQKGGPVPSSVAFCATFPPRRRLSHEKSPDGAFYLHIFKSFQDTSALHSHAVAVSGEGNRYRREKKEYCSVYKHYAISYRKVFDEISDDYGSKSLS